MLQLIDTGVHVMNPKSRKLLGSKEVMEKYGVFPHQLIDYMALVGDTSVSRN